MKVIKKRSEIKTLSDIKNWRINQQVTSTMRNVKEGLLIRRGNTWLGRGSSFSLEGGCGNPLQGSGLENPMDRGAWQPSVNRITENRTQAHVQ